MSALPAGEFSRWLTSMTEAVHGGRDADVPCAGCTACCAASQFVHIGPDEHATLARIPPALLFPAPRMPAGHRLLGYDERGRCPLLTDAGCSIYEDRPRTCRTYDCRLFAATGVDVEAGGAPGTRSAVADRVRRWRFALASDDDRRALAAVRAAARHLHQHGDRLPPPATGVTGARLALLAIEVHELFLDGRQPTPGALAAAVEACTARWPTG